MNTQTTGSWEAFARTILMVAIAAVVSWLSVQANITGWVNPTIALVISGLAGVIEAQLKNSGYGALFGSVK